MADLTLRFINAACGTTLMSVRADDRAGRNLFATALAISVTGITVFGTTFSLFIPDSGATDMICAVELTVGAVTGLADRLRCAGRLATCVVYFRIRCITP